MSLSRDGTLVYLDTGRVVEQRLAWRDRAGKLLEQSRQMHESIETVAVSPDTKRALITARDGSIGMWLYDLDRLVRTRLDVGSGLESSTALFGFFTRPGDEIYYTLLKAPGETAVYAKSADGFGQPRPVMAPNGFKVAQARSADGQYVIGVCAPCGSVNRQIVVWRNDDAASDHAAIELVLRTPPLSWRRHSPRMAGSSPTPRRSADGLRSTFVNSRTALAGGRFPQTGEGHRRGAVTATSCSSTKGLR